MRCRRDFRAHLRIQGPRRFKPVRVGSGSVRSCHRVRVHERGSLPDMSLHWICVRVFVVRFSLSLVLINDDRVRLLDCKRREENDGRGNQPAD